MLEEYLPYLLFLTPLAVYLSGIYKEKTSSIMMSVGAFLLAYSSVFVLKDLPIAQKILTFVTFVMLSYHLTVPILLRIKRGRTVN